MTKRKSRKALSYAVAGRLLGWGSLVTFSLIMLGLAFPVADRASSALGEDVTMVSSLNTKTTAYLYSTIALATSGEIDIELVPKANGALEVGAADVVVSTNNTTGYSLTLSTVDQTNKLNQKDKTAQYAGSTEEYAIEPLGNAVTKAEYLSEPANFNTWGYAMTKGAANDSTEYHGLATAAGETIYTTNGTSSQDSYKLNVAVAVDTSLPAGGYQNGLVITAVANPIVVSGFNQIYYMQDMTPAVCESAEMESTAQLIDKRDNNIYWVAKLKDGNCWMTQNLALDLSTEVALTPEDSDVSSEWTPTFNTEREIPEKTEADYTSERSWNLGKIVLTNPTTSVLCSMPLPEDLAGQGYTQDGSDSVYHGYNLADKCPIYRDVTGMAASNKPGFATETSAVQGNFYDAHYLIGNYYSWNAATAGSGVVTDITNTGKAEANVDPEKLVDATESICPKGWRLPVSGRYRNVDISYPFERDDSFMGLLVSYDYPEGNASAGWIANNGYPYTPVKDEIKPDYYPMFFSRNGAINPSTGTIRVLGGKGFYWSSTAYPNAENFAYAFDFISTDIYPSDSRNRYSGYSVRCVAK